MYSSLGKEDFYLQDFSKSKVAETYRRKALQLGTQLLYWKGNTTIIWATVGMANS
jgi:hypothetical protein